VYYWTNLKDELVTPVLIGLGERWRLDEDLTSAEQCYRLVSIANPGRSVVEVTHVGGPIPFKLVALCSSQTEHDALEECLAAVGLTLQLERDDVHQGLSELAPNPYVKET
jgi:hypothetical protein